MKPRLDLNLLFIAESLYRTSNVSRTGRELGLSQSAVSHALSKLRDHFNDPLFVRVAKGVSATYKAKQLRSEIEDLARRARALAHSEKFDAKKARATITIATTDLIEIVLMPGLLKRLKREAPGLQISLRPTGGDLPKAELESGVFDIAIAGFYKNPPEGFFQTKVMETGFSTAYRKHHSSIKRELKLAQFYDCDHALVTLQGDLEDGHRRKIDGELRRRRFAFGSYSFTGLAWTLANTDLVLTAPTILLEKYREYFPIHVQKSPLDIPKIEIRMLWHALTHRDPLHVWFRDVLKEELSAQAS